METLNEDFLEFIRLLENHRVNYLIIGGYAVNSSLSPNNESQISNDS